MATNVEIKGWFDLLRRIGVEAAGSDSGLSTAERDVVKAGADAAARLAETIVLDLNRIADSLEQLAYHSNVRLDRGQ